MGKIAVSSTAYSFSAEINDVEKVGGGTVTEFAIYIEYSLTCFSVRRLHNFHAARQ